MEEKRVLDSWKEIAGYLGRSVKTCRRWEHELGLPIHRLEESPKARVFAYPDELDQWVKTTQKSEDSQKRIIPRAKKFFIPALAFFIFFIAAAIWQMLPQKETLSVPSDKPCLVILSFQNNTGDSRFDMWEDMLPQLMITDLFQSQLLHVVSDDRLNEVLMDLKLLDENNFSTKDLQTLTSQLAATHIIRGFIARSGDTIRFNYYLQDSASMEIIGSNWVEGKSDSDLFASVDELTKMIKQNFGLSQEQILSDIDKTIGKITTSSPEAYKYLIEGNRCAARGNQTEAIHFYERSIDVDPEFATAYLVLAIANWYVGKYSEYKKYLRKSFELRNHASQREQYLIEGEFYSLSESTFDLAIKAATDLLKIYPDDSWGRRELGWLYFAIEEWNKCIEQFSFLLKNKNPSFNPYQMSSFAYRAKGAYKEAIEVLENFLESYPDNTYVFLSIANVFICLGKLENALIEVNKAISFNPNDNIYNRIKGDVFLFKGKLIQAEEEYQKYKKNKLLSPIMNGIRRLASLYLLQGKFRDSYLKAQEGLDRAKKSNDNEWICLWLCVLANLDIKLGYHEKALQKLTKAYEIANEESDVQCQREALHLKAIAYLESGLINEAQNTTDELTELLQNSMNKKIIRLSYHLLGMMELKKGKPSKAIIHFEKALALMPFQYHPVHGNNHALYMGPLAFSYYKTGDLGRAQKEYEKIVALTLGRLHHGDIYAKAFYMLGQIYEQKGWEGKAIDHYKTFLNLWKDADPDLPDIKDAKRRLANLQTKNHR